MHVPSPSRPPAQHALNFNIEPPAPLQFVLWEHIAPLIDYIQTLESRVIQLEEGLSEYVDTKEALRITGIKTPETLKRERERPGTLIITKSEGETNKHPRYLRASLIAYNESRRARPREHPRNSSLMFAWCG